MNKRFIKAVGKKILSGIQFFSPINFLSAVLIVLLFNIVFSLYSTINYVPWHIDEAYWMQGTYFYHLFFQKKDVSNKDWHNYMAYDHPPVGKYILGLSLQAGNHHVAASSGGLKIWYRSANMNGFMQQLAGDIWKYHLPADKKMLVYSYSLLDQIKGPVKATSFTYQDYMAGRRTIFFFGILAAALLFAAGSYAFKNPFLGLLAGLVFLDNKTTIPAFQQVLVDSICSFFVLLALLLLFWLFRELSAKKRSRKKITSLAVLEGLVLALALGTKFITMYMVITVVIVFLASILFEYVRSKRKGDKFPAGRAALRAGILIIISASAFAFFVLLNPFLYSHPIGNTLLMFRHRNIIMHIQARVQVPAINSFAERIAVIFEKGILLGYPFPNLPAILLYIFSILVGMGVLIKRSFDELSGGTFGARTIVLLWVVITFILNGLMVNMEWDRYYIPFAMCSALIFAVGVGSILDFFGVHIPGFNDNVS